MRIGFPTELSGDNIGSWVELIWNGSCEPSKIYFSYIDEIRGRVEKDSVFPDHALWDDGEPLSFEIANVHNSVYDYYRKYHGTKTDTIEYYLPDSSSNIKEGRLKCVGPSPKLAILLAYAQQSRGDPEDPLLLFSASFSVSTSGSITIAPLNASAVSWRKKWLQVVKSKASALIIHKRDAKDLLKSFDGITIRSLDEWNTKVQLKDPIVVTVGPDDIERLAKKLGLPKTYFSAKSIWDRKGIKILLSLTFILLIASLVVSKWDYVYKISLLDDVLDTSKRPHDKTLPPKEHASNVKCDRMEMVEPTPEEERFIVQLTDLSVVNNYAAEAGCMTLNNNRTDVWQRLRCLNDLFNKMANKPEEFINICNKENNNDIFENAKKDIADTYLCVNSHAKQQCDGPEALEECCSKYEEQLSRLGCYKFIYGYLKKIHEGTRL